MSASLPTPVVSVLLPLYNSASTIVRALRSAQAQTISDIEILVTDDGSTDDGPALVDAIAATDRRIRLIRLPRNGGKPRAMNLMMAEAKGQYAAVLDADDAYHPHRLEILLRPLAAGQTEMAADNLRYIDAGAPATDGSGNGRFVRFGFDPAGADRILTRDTLIQAADNFANFDYGLLKPIVDLGFVRRHALAYDETTRLGEDFTYLVEFMAAGGRAFVSAQPLYDWTMPFGTFSRRWTETGAGPWRYEYAPLIAANARLIGRLGAAGHMDLVDMLTRRDRQYRVMAQYITAQRLAAGGAYLAAAGTLLRNVGTIPLLARRILGRAVRSLKSPTAEGRSRAIVGSR